MRLETKDKTYLMTQDEYGKVYNQPVLIVAKTGGGKGLALEMYQEDYYNQDAVVISLCDFKQERETAFPMFEAEEPYHLNCLRAIGKKPERKPVKIYHPFVYGIPKGYLPKYNFYTISLKDLGDGEFSLLAETNLKNDLVLMLERASSQISREDGIYGFVDKLKSQLKGKSKKGKKIADWDNLGLETGGVGTAKELSRIGGCIKPFEELGFLTKDNSPYKLNWEEILNDQKHYHVFLTNFIDEKKYGKQIGFIILYLVQSIISNKVLMKKHVILSIPEIKNLVPLRPEGWKQFLGESFTKAISTLRSAGISIVADTQNWVGLSQEIKDVFKSNLLGELTGDDIEAITKKWGGLNKDYKEFFRKPDKRNTFVLMEMKDFQPFTIFLPSHMHKEPIPNKYNFENVYKRYNKKFPKEFPLVNYEGLVKEMKEIAKNEKNKFIEKDKKRKAEEELEEQKKIEQKESKKSENQIVEKKIEKVKETNEKIDKIKMKLCYDMHRENPEMPFREIARELTKKGYEGLKTHNSVIKNIEKYEKILQEEQVKDFADKFLEENIQS